MGERGGCGMSVKKLIIRHFSTFHAQMKCLQGQFTLDSDLIVVD